MEVDIEEFWLGILPTNSLYYFAMWWIWVWITYEGIEIADLLRGRHATTREWTGFHCWCSGVSRNNVSYATV